MYICQQLANMPDSFKAGVMQEYGRVWIDSANNEPLGHRKDNTGRRAANLYLLDAVENYKMKHKIDYQIAQTCSNCEKLDLSDVCQVFEQQVPPEYKEQENDCDEWNMGVPF